MGKVEHQPIFQLREFSDSLKEVEVSSEYVVVTPGEVISNESGYLRGHGTYVEGDQLLASVAGVVEKVNQLISVRPLKSRYIGEVGDILVGRISEVGNKRWKVDVNGHQDGILMLSSVNLPGGAQRRRTYEDQLQMRSFFNENELISAEVQEIRYDGTVWLHTRSLRYGKLENGQFVSVSPALIKRMKQHIVTLPFGVDVILGNNGYIWIARTIAAEEMEDTTVGTDTRAETLLRQKKAHADKVTAPQDRLRIAQVRNCIVTLNSKFQIISPESILNMYETKYKSVA